MGFEKLPPDTEFQTPPDAGNAEFYPTPGFWQRFQKRRANRRQRQADLRNNDPRYYLGPAAAALVSFEETGLTNPELGSLPAGDGDRFYYGRRDTFKPEPLGIFAAEPIASALSYAKSLEPETTEESADG